jgi:hypothetical protein
MVRTQVYLPRDVHATLTRRAQAQGLTLAEQIRTALDEYLARVAAVEAEGVLLRPDDPLIELMGGFDSGLEDLGFDHDHYLYGAPRRSAQPAVAEAPADYEPRQPRTRKKAQ